MNSGVRAAETGGLGKLQVTQKERPVSAAGTSYVYARRRKTASSSGISSVLILSWFKLDSVKRMKGANVTFLNHGSMGKNRCVVVMKSGERIAYSQPLAHSNTLRFLSCQAIYARNSAVLCLLSYKGTDPLESC